MGARRSAAVALAAVAALAATASAASVPSLSVKTFPSAHGKAVVVHHATAAPSAAPTPCLIRFDCSVNRTQAASCPTVVAVPAPCGGVGGGGGAHGAGRAKFGAVCLIEKTVDRPCQKVVTVARTCVKACPTPTPTPTPTPCLITFDCSFNRTQAASCPTVVTVPVPCGGVAGGAHGTVRANFAATCLIEKTVDRPCQKVVTVARTCVKACPTPTPTPCTVEVACTKVVEVQVERKVVVACPNTAQFFDADGKALAVCQTIQQVVELQTVAATCVQACATEPPQPTAGAHTDVVLVAQAAAPKAAAAAHGHKGFLGVPAKAWVGLLGKALVGLKGGKQGGATPTPTASPTSSAAPGTGAVSAGNGGNGGDGGAGPEGADGGAGGAGGNLIVAPAPSPAMRAAF